MQSIGERLEEARKRKGISIREAAEATKIRSDYLHKFESNQYDIKLPEIYVRGFLRTYSNYLKLPAEKIVSDYNGLGLGDSKQRLSREIYGRMDLTVSSARDKDSGPDPTSGESAPPIDAGPRNPATFVPPSSGSPFDKNLIIKASVIVAGIAVAVFLISWLVFGRSSQTAGSGSASAGTPSSGEIYVSPKPGERTIGLVAVGRVSVTATQVDKSSPSRSEKIVLFRGTLSAGESRDIPRNGSQIDIVTDNRANLKFRIDGKLWPMPEGRNDAAIDRADLR